MKLTWPAGIDEAHFLANYWQKKPLLIPDAFNEFENPLDADELAGLACDEDSNARYIEHTGSNEWRLFLVMNGRYWYLISKNCCQTSDNTSSPSVFYRIGASTI